MSYSTFTAAFALNFDYGSMTVNSDPRVDPNSYLFFRYGNASQSKFMGPAGDYSISAPEIQTDPQGHQRKFDRWTNEYSTGIGSSPSLTATISSNTNLFKANYYEIPTTPSIKPLVSSTGVDGGPVKVSWNPSLGPVTYYEVSRKIDNYPGVWEVVTTATSTFWIDATAFYCPVGGQFGASYRVRAYGAGYWSNYSDVASERVEDGGFSNMKMGNEEFGQMGEESALVTSYALNQNYPNPFNPSTTISYAVPQDGNVTLKVYDMAGHEVASLVDGYKSAGRYSVKFDAAKLSSGIYIYKIQAGSYSAMKKMQLVK